MPGNSHFRPPRLTCSDSLAARGATNSTISPATFVSIPITLQIGTFSATVTVGISYKATQNQSGKGTYTFLKTGKTITGAFIIKKFSAKQGVAQSGPVHTYAIQGQLVRPNGGRYKPSGSGQFGFTRIGTYSVAHPGWAIYCGFERESEIQIARRHRRVEEICHRAEVGDIFNMTMDKVPATGSSGKRIAHDRNGYCGRQPGAFVSVRFGLMGN